jgi:hypothetical protein
MIPYIRLGVRPAFWRAVFVRLDQSSSAFPAAMAASIWSRTTLATGSGTESSVATFNRSRLSLRPKAKVAPGGVYMPVAIRVP